MRRLCVSFCAPECLVTLVQAEAAAEVITADTGDWTQRFSRQRPRRLSQCSETRADSLMLAESQTP